MRALEFDARGSVDTAFQVYVKKKAAIFGGLSILEYILSVIFWRNHISLATRGQQLAIRF